MNVLLTGATGYIGRRLKERLLKEKDVNLTLFVRNARKVRDTTKKKTTIVEGDTFDRKALDRACAGIDVAYYLIHSMMSKGDYRDLDRRSAENFREACIAAGVRRIIYLGGLGTKAHASKHILSRIETGEILSARPELVQTFWFRAGMIIGSGSASFEILWNYVEKAPVMFAPRSIHTKTQAIAVADLLTYLEQGRKLVTNGNLIFDLGSNVMSFTNMLSRTASFIGVKRRIFTLPFITPRLSSYILSLIFPVPHKLTHALLKSLRCESVSKNDNAKKYFPEITPASFEEAVKTAIQEIEDNIVVSRWSDSSAAESCDIADNTEISKDVFTDRRITSFAPLPSSAVFRSVMSIGGENGWFTYHFLWEVRGLIDKLLGGYGIKRGRRDIWHLRIGDSVDFWKVADIVENHRLLLCAQMKLPGKAWLKFVIENDHLIQTAYFLPYGFWGVVYWYLMKPSHFFIFRDMAKSIIKKAAELQNN